MEKETFILETEEGSINCEVILRFYSEKYQKNYLIYTDHSFDGNQEENIFVSSYNLEDKTNMLQDILDKKELEEIEKQLEKWESE